MLLLILEIEEEKERENIDVREKHPCVASCMRPNWELNLQTFEAQDDAPTNWVTRPGLFNTSFEVIFPASFFFYWLIDLNERARETLIGFSPYLCIRWLILVCALTRDQTCNLGVSGQCSNQATHLGVSGWCCKQLSYTARASSVILEHFSTLNFILLYLFLTALIWLPLIDNKTQSLLPT